MISVSRNNLVRSDSMAASAQGAPPELLAPAGDWECARAAVENGADGIYFGVERFNARMRAHNFTLADLPELMAFLHRRGVKGYVTFNTLIFADELAQAEEFLRAIIAAGVDAAIVQDIGLARLIRVISPDFPIHASTQMTVTTAAGVEWMGELGCQRVILARECPIPEIENIHRTLAASGHPYPELEVFVHGALCVAYSGQCLTSEALGGRSANRGECAQACRMPYELISDGQVVPLGDRRYLLSPQDLAGLELLSDLAHAGVVSFKIEGRLKSPEYVANVTRIYRKAIEEERLTIDAKRDENDPNRIRKVQLRAEAPTAQARYDLEMAFSRGLYTGWLRGINNQQLVHARFGKKRGVYLGEVARVQGERVFVRLQAPLKPGDGLVFDAGRPDQPEEGGRVYQVQMSRTSAHGRRLAEEVGLSFGRGDIDFRRIHRGDRIWKTSDPELDRRVRQTFQGRQPRFQRALHIEVRGRAGEPMVLRVQDEAGHLVELCSAMPLALAEHKPLTVERLSEQLGRLGGTPFKLGSLKSLLEGELILPVSELNRLRRQVGAKLEELRVQPKRWTVRAQTESRSIGISVANRPQSPSSSLLSMPAELIVLVRTCEQLEAAWRQGARTLYVEFEDPKKYREAVAYFRGWQRDESGAALSSIWVAPPRITKTGEEWILKQVQSCEADGYLVRNYDHLKYFADLRCIGDFSLNVANPLTAEYFIQRHGLERLTASYDLNAVQLEALLRAAPPEWFEITIHQHIPMFHMEHCVFCAFLSQGTDYTNCGRPCDQHEVHLRDRVGARHPVKADAGCRNTVFNGTPQTGAEYVARFLALGARRFRLEFLNESPARVGQTIGMYRRLLRGEVTGSQVWRELKLVNRLGVTRGPMEHVEPKLPRWGEIEW